MQNQQRYRYISFHNWYKFDAFSIYITKRVLPGYNNIYIDVRMFHSGYTCNIRLRYLYLCQDVPLGIYPSITNSESPSCCSFLYSSYFFKDSDRWVHLQNKIRLQQLAGREYNSKKKHRLCGCCSNININTLLIIMMMIITFYTESLR